MKEVNLKLKGGLKTQDLKATQKGNHHCLSWSGKPRQGFRNAHSKAIYWWLNSTMHFSLVTQKHCACWSNSSSTQQNLMYLASNVLLSHNYMLGFNLLQKLL